MKTVRRVTITARDPKSDRYDYKRESKLALSEEHFSAEEAKDVTTAFLALAIAKGLSFETATEELEIPVDEDESFKVKYEQAQKTISSGYTERSKISKENETLKARVEALKAVCPDNHTQPEDDEDTDKDTL